MFAVALFFLFVALAGRVMGFSITVGSVNLNATQILDIPASPLLTTCNTNCSNAKSKLQNCNDDPTCLCDADTVSSLLTCEQCMFSALIVANKPMPDMRAGSTPVLSGYATSCAGANITLLPAQTALQLPLNWDGPFDAILPMGGAVVAVGVGFLLGVSAILLLSNM